jgi:hypothetical protein
MGRVLYEQGEVLVRTPLSANHFAGFNDICPWDGDDKSIVLLRYPKGLLRVPDGKDVAEVCVWDVEGGRVLPVGTTTAWNYQQGARCRWLDTGRILYNDLLNGDPCARVVSRSGALLQTLTHGVYALSADGTTAVSPSFGRLGRYYPGYGYPSAGAPSIDSAHPNDDGIWLIDIRSNSTRLLFSLEQLSNLTQFPRQAKQFVSHMLFNPSGTHFLFGHSFITSDGAKFSRLLVASATDGDLQCVGSEITSHPCWCDDETIVMWARYSSALSSLRRRNALRHPALQFLIKLARRWQGKSRNFVLREGLYVVNTAPAVARKRIGHATITENGHFSCHPKATIILGDTYADKHNLLHLYLYDIEHDVKVELRAFDHGVATRDGAQRCDLHPRWNRQGSNVAVDACEAGTRYVAIVDARQGLTLLRQ